MRLLAISDLHLSHRTNREALFELGDFPRRLADRRRRRRRIARASRRSRSRELTPRFAQGDLDARQSRSLEPARTRPIARAASGPLRRARRHLPRLRRDLRPRIRIRSGRANRTRSSCRCSCSTTTRSGPRTCRSTEAVAWARQTGVVCGDEFMLDPQPWPSRIAWCQARVRRDRGAARRAARPGAHGARQSLAASRYDLARPPRIPRFSIWCGTTAHRRLGAPLSRARRRLRPSAPAHDAVAARRALRRSVARLSARLAARARARVLPARDPAGHRAPTRSGSRRRGIRSMRV